MAINQLIAAGIQQPRFESPLNMMAQFAQLQQAQQANALNQMRMQQMQRQMAQEEALAGALRSGRPLTLEQALMGGERGLRALELQETFGERERKRKSAGQQLAAEALMETSPNLGDFAETYRRLKEQGVDMGPRAAELMLMPQEQRAREMQREVALTPGMGPVVAAREKSAAEVAKLTAERRRQEGEFQKLQMQMQGTLPEPTPAGVREAEWYRKASPDQRAAYDAAKASGRPVTQIINAQEGALQKKLGDVKGTTIEKGLAAAQDAESIIDTIGVGRQILNAGATTGFGANFLVNVGQALRQVGVDLNADESANAQTYMANMAQNVGRIIKQFGAGTGLSNADREYAEKMAGGNITLDERALRRILDINEKMSRNVIKRHNDNVKRFNAGEEFLIQEPPSAETSMRPENKQALDWARQNPNDPRAAQILRILKGQE